MGDHLGGDGINLITGVGFGTAEVVMGRALLGHHVGRDQIEQQFAVFVEAKVEDVARPGKVDFNDLFDPARGWAHHHRAVSEVDRFLDVVRNKDHRLSGAGDELVEVFLKLAAGMLVERRERFVRQQDSRRVRERPDDGDAMPHAAGELVRQVVSELEQTDHC